MDESGGSILIEVKGLRAARGDFALKQVGFSVKKGEALAVLGADGAGKTVLMDALSGVLEIEPGQVSVCGVDIALHPSDAKEHLGYMPAEPPLYRDMTLRSYLKFVCDAKWLSHRDASEQIARALKLIDLTDLADAKIARLSEGVRRRASLAQALIGDAEVLLLDEPTRGLDPKEIAQLRALIREIAPEKCVVLASRNVSEAFRLCENALVLKDGAVAARSKASELSQASMETARVRVCVAAGADKLKSALSSLAADIAEAGEGNGEAWAILAPKGKGDLRADAAKAVANAGLALLELGRERASLDEVLLSLDGDPYVEEASGNEGDQ